MKTHNLIQGTPEWHTYRAQHFNASDAPAMLGVSPYKTRTQLLHELHTGLAAEVDQATQRRFNDGHRFEALARPLAEAIIGEELYPVVGSDGDLSASFDGLTMDESTNFEHKSLNDNLRAIMSGGCTGADLDLQYRVQMEQQHMVSGASRTLFMATKWDGDELVESAHCWYHTDLELRERIKQGWTQFAKDLANYTPVEVVAKPVGHTPESLPALRIEVTGMVTASNLAQYKEHALAVFAGINRNLTSDQDFADADKIVKWCGDVEDRLAAAKQHALSQTESIDALFRTIDDISAEARRVRLELNTLVKARKEALRVEIVTEGAKALAIHLEALNTRIGKPYMTAVPADFAGAIKGKRSLESIRDAVNTTLANAKIAASAIADRIQINLSALNELEADYSELFPDVAQLVLKDSYDLTELINGRIASHKLKEAQRIERARLAEEERVKAEAIAKAAAELATAKASEGSALSPAAQMLNEAEGAARFAKTHPSITHEAVVALMPASVVEAMKPEKAAPPAISETRAALNAQLDRLGETELLRVLNFVRSRYGELVAA